MKILVTGGAGYIASHTVVELLGVGWDVVVLDNLANSSEVSLVRIAQIAGREPLFVLGDILDEALLATLFREHKFDAVIHFAGLKAVGDSVKDPLAYYQTNVAGSLSLFSAMAAAGVFRLVFSSSATVYGEPEVMPISEQYPVGAPKSPYGRSKLIVEQVLEDLVRADDRWAIATLRYFNPVGAHPSGLIGENPNGTPNNLLPYISKVVTGKLPYLSIYGNDYPTCDGTGVRDYIHVADLANGHISALRYIAEKTGLHAWNLGTGVGYSVLQVIAAFEKVSGVEVPQKICERRPGDIAECWSDPSKALRELGWRAELDLEDMMRDTWRWLQSNPDGYQSK
ncbi:UDP-glucose 4-epimerase GalE [Pseudomonas sp. PA-7-1E]|uniref:UDP-glucose 4-epimerase GalE n=1 Tax=Pseudomonas TaxID=286 RepID=UPI0009153718|nr:MULTISPECIES: UDP-glucose 4-epimerase GalE [Pseudomonas]MBA6044717.1 UDP-glucose 4-epimerase GalE [Pseudomonas lactis]MBC6622127.1 UDP-glucose 4-epimerase GalE [Pseudomonas sp.]MBH3466865.1 UDP-glucose 4-epimerase GalE [Pseudomonas carnis]MBK3472959.1 UDP-glucose 4-epimerase GalE [Pseudomonas carnis]MCF5041953.1 UDP-glucose 4-epimerase GalE [Pseudomonas sp. PA-7-1E]